MKRVTRLTFLLLALASRTVLAGNPGALDTGFGFGNGTPEDIYTSAVQADGKTIIGGLFTQYDGNARSRIARLNVDGSLDSTFNSAGTDINNYVAAIALQTDGKILIGGEFTAVNGVTSNHVARLNANGSLDSSFNTTSSLYSTPTIYTLAIQPDGKIIVGGRAQAKRLNANGSLDCDFNLDNNGTAFTSALQSDGKILIAGQFYSVQGQASPDISRLNTDCSFDNTLYPLAQADMDQIRALSVLPDGKILFGGLSDSSLGRIMRRNADGFADSGFTSSRRFNAGVYSLVVQPDGKIVAGGAFTGIVTGSAINRIARINGDGTLDTGFNTGSSADNVVRTIATQNSGKLLIAGSFTSVDGVSRNRIALIHTGDMDGDAVEDAGDAFPFNPAEFVDTDHDGIGNNADTDDDNDGVPDYIDADPLNAANATETRFNVNGIYMGAQVKESVLRK